jgi:crotonobetainyl-CoA:carnitine CoA-transferase CaiB-like acyl-CoA transferase
MAKLLAEHGVDVIHVDLPGGPRLTRLPDAFRNCSVPPTVHPQ